MAEHPLVRPRINREQEITGFDLLAFLKMDFHDLASDLGTNGDGGIGLHIADVPQFDRNVLSFSLCDDYRDRCASVCLGRDPSRRFFGATVEEGEADADLKSSKHQHPSSREAPSTKLQSSAQAAIWCLGFGASL